MNQLKSIVAGVDFSDCSRSALRQAVRVAQWNNAHLHVIHVIEYLVITDLADAMGHTIGRIQADAVREGTEQLEAWLAAADPAGPHSVDVVVAPPLDGLLRKVQSVKADLLVLGVRGDSMFPSGAGMLATKCMRKAPTKVMLDLGYVLLGSTVERLLRDLPCSVLTVRAFTATAASAPAQAEQTFSSENQEQKPTSAGI